MYFLLLLQNQWTLSERVLLGGDAAIQQLLGHAAINFHEARGIYSRVGFHHPGPGVAYLWGSADWLGRSLHLPLGPSNAALLGGFALISAIVGSTVVLARSHLGTWTAGAVVVAGVALSSWKFPGSLGGFWIPVTTGAVVMLLLVSVASVVAGRAGSLYAVAATAALALQAHIAMATFVLGGLLVLAIGGWTTGFWKAAWSESRRTLVGSASLFLFMMLPPMANTVANWPGELARYSRFARTSTVGPRSPGDVLRYVLQFWPGSSPLVQGLLVSLGFIALALASRWRRSTFGAALGVACAVGEAALVFYAARGVDNLAFTYLALFSVAIPGVVLGGAAAVALSAALSSGRAASALRISLGAACVLAVGLSPAVDTASGVTMLPPETVKQVMKITRRLDGNVLAISSDSNEQLPFIWAPGIVLAASSIDAPICLEGPGWPLRLGPVWTCTRRQLRTAQRFRLTPAKDAAAGSIGPFRLVPLRR